MNRKNNTLFFGFLLAGFAFFLAGGCKKKDKEEETIRETGTVKDFENNVYKTVKIGNQWWMAENLKSTLYQDGSFIVYAQSDTMVWNNDTVGAYCQYGNNASAPGLLYNWYAVNNTAGLAPKGWHIPTDEEWKELELYLGMSSTEAEKVSWRGASISGKLKIEAPKGWTTYDEVWSENESGFTALAGGCRLFNGVFGQPGLFATGFWWTSSETPDQEGWYRYMDYKNNGVFRSHTYKNYGYSVRCVKDK